MHFHRSHIAFLLLSFVAFNCARASAEDKKDEANAIIARARAVMDMRTSDSKPFQLAAGFHFDADRISYEPEADGMYTETWNSPSRWRLEIDLPDIQQIEVGENNKRWLTQDISLERGHIFSVRNELNFSRIEVDKILKVSSRNMDGKEIKCIETRLEGGNETTYCFDGANGTLVETGQKNSFFKSSCVYTNYQTFTNKMYPHDIQCLTNGSPWFEATITSIREDATPADSKLFVPPSGSKEWPVCARVIPPQRISAPDPVHIGSGVEALEALIGLDGKLTNITVTQSSGSMFDAEALKTTSKWKFKPATCAGVPIPIKIEIKIAFE